MTEWWEIPAGDVIQLEHATLGSRHSVDRTSACVQALLTFTVNN